MNWLCRFHFSISHDDVNHCCTISDNERLETEIGTLQAECSRLEHDADVERSVYEELKKQAANVHEEIEFHCSMSPLIDFNDKFKY